MRIVTLCGMGFGSSLMLKMTIEDILRARGIKAEVVAWDLGSFKGQQADVVVAPDDMERHLKDYPGVVVLISNLVDRKEIETKVVGAVEGLLKGAGGTK
ncbi:MAG: PTS sugar transporter subunit IIB [Firmicutes bacterium]|nr:PTS sugar transporter subunit IIB [Candidatus Fermentithermobacillaceae bacterium]